MEINWIYIPTLFVAVPYIQQRRGLVDCGVFDIAFPVHKALGDDVTIETVLHDLLRDKFLVS